MPCSTAASALWATKDSIERKIMAKVAHGAWIRANAGSSPKIGRKLSPSRFHGYPRLWPRKHDQ
ncbi:GAF domain nucleotide-binding protein [Histoplasma ohiense]|nr:GAF domain nucleotide-binding protein [Histoplasma ohiense (nom. inval.)]